MKIPLLLVLAIAMLIIIYLVVINELYYKRGIVSRFISVHTSGEDIQNTVDELYEDYKLRG